MTVKCRTCGREYSGGEKFCSIDGTPLGESPKAVAQRTMYKIDSGTPSAEALQDEHIGTVINNRYRIAQKLGEGGTSIVYLALRESINEPVAIKFLKPELAMRMGSVERFIVEARASSRVDHPNIVSVFDFGRTEDDRYYLVMEYVYGRSLIRSIKDNRGYDQLRTVGILRQLLSAAGAAHAENIVHRDLKPENVVLTSQRGTKDFIKVLDFGLAKFTGDSGEETRITRHGVVLGTPYYMSPEQARCEKVDYRTDLYSIGVMTYEMLTGVVPFRGGSPIEVLNRHILKKPTPPSIQRPDAVIHPELEHLVMTLLSKSPKRRYQTAEETLMMLDQVLERILAEPVKKGDLAAHARNIKGTPVRVRQSTPPPPRPTVTTIWEAPGLLEDSSRLVKLWDDRIQEVADKFWGHSSWPDDVVKTVEWIRSLEREIETVEKGLTPVKLEIEQIERRSREAEAALRFERLDLVARMCIVREMIGGGVELSNFGELSAKVSLLGMDDFIFSKDKSYKTLQDLYDSLDQRIDELDRDARRLRRQTKRDIATRNRTLHGKINEVRSLRQRQIPLCKALLERLNEEAAGRGDLAKDVIAVAEVAGALQIFQTLLSSIRSPDESSSDS